jgi:hypothetical protein
VLFETAVFLRPQRWDFAELVEAVGPLAEFDPFFLKELFATLPESGLIGLLDVDFTIGAFL